MSLGGKTGVLALLRRFTSGLRYPQLFLLFAALFAVDLAVPDILPFADELLLGFGTLLLAGLRKRKAP